MVAPRNPSELQRLEEELKYWRNNIKHHVGSKSTKEYILRQIRQCEQALGIESKPYNSNAFTDELKKELDR